MPSFEMGAKTFEISRAAVITDSNLFVEAFVPGSPDYALTPEHFSETGCQRAAAWRTMRVTRGC